MTMSWREPTVAEERAMAEHAETMAELGQLQLDVCRLGEAAKAMLRALDDAERTDAVRKAEIELRAAVEQADPPSATVHVNTQRAEELQKRLQQYEYLAMHTRGLVAHLDIMLAARLPGEPDMYCHLPDVRATLQELLRPVDGAAATAHVPAWDGRMQLKHGDKVVYIAPSDRDFGVVQGHVYTVFGNYPPIPMPGLRQSDEVSIYVDDPGDAFGGVVDLPASCFRALEGGGK
jgi:hypothetical protein